jgi:hypothetical protein
VSRKPSHVVHVDSGDDRAAFDFCRSHDERIHGVLRAAPDGTQ